LDIFLTEEESVPKTVWTGGMFDAGKYGASLVKLIVGKTFHTLSHYMQSRNA